jgi:hypothetical protein
MNNEPMRPRPTPVLEILDVSIVDRAPGRVPSLSTDVLPDPVFWALAEAHDLAVHASYLVLTLTGWITQRVRSRGTS